LEVAVTDIEPDRNRIIASAKAVTTSKVLKELKIGQLVTGRIQGVSHVQTLHTTDRWCLSLHVMELLSPLLIPTKLDCFM